MNRLQDGHRRWMLLVAQLVYPLDPARAGAALVPILEQIDLPDMAFTEDSARAVARADRRLAIPDFAELEGALTAWWRENRPRPPMLVAPVVSVVPEIQRCTPEQSAEILRKHGYGYLVDGVAAPALDGGAVARGAKPLDAVMLSALRANQVKKS